MSTIIVPASCLAAVATGALIPLATTGNLLPGKPVSAVEDPTPAPLGAVFAKTQTFAPDPQTHPGQEPLAAMPVLTAPDAAVPLLDTQDSPAHHPDAIALEINGQQFHVGPAPLVTVQPE